MHDLLTAATYIPRLRAIEDRPSNRNKYGAYVPLTLNIGTRCTLIFNQKRSLQLETKRKIRKIPTVSHVGQIHLNTEWNHLRSDKTTGYISSLTSKTLTMCPFLSTPISIENGSASSRIFSSLESVQPKTKWRKTEAQNVKLDCWSAIQGPQPSPFAKRRKTLGDGTQRFKKAYGLSTLTFTFLGFAHFDEKGAAKEHACYGTDHSYVLPQLVLCLLSKNSAK